YWRLGCSPVTASVTLVLAAASRAVTVAVAPAGTSALSYVGGVAGGAANVPLAVTMRAESVAGAAAPAVAPPQATSVVTPRTATTAAGDTCMSRGCRKTARM